LSKQLAQHLTAGRVQSVAVRLIVEREREIEGFTPEEYWKLLSLVRPSALGKGDPADPTVLKIPYQKKQPRGFKKAEEADDDHAHEAHAVAEAQSPDGQPGAETPAAPEPPKIPENAFWTELAEYAGKKFEPKTEADIDAVLAKLKGAKYVVSKIEQKDRNE